MLLIVPSLLTPLHVGSEGGSERGRLPTMKSLLSPRSSTIPSPLGPAKVQRIRSPDQRIPGPVSSFFPSYRR